MKKNSCMTCMTCMFNLILLKYRQYKQKTTPYKHHTKPYNTIQTYKTYTIQDILSRGRPFFRIFATPMKSKQNTGLYAFILQFRGLYDGK